MMESKLPLSEKTKSGMSLNIDDQKWIKLLFDRQDQFIKDTYDQHAVYIIDAVKDLLKDHMAAINLRFDSIETRLHSMEKGACEREIRIAVLEKRASVPNMIVRYGIIVIISLILGWILHSLLT